MARIVVPGGDPQSEGEKAKRDARAVLANLKPALDTLRLDKDATTTAIDSIKPEVFNPLTNADKIARLRDAAAVDLKNQKDIQAVLIDAVKALRYLLHEAGENA